MEYTTTLTREKAWEILNQYNQEPFHLRHAQVVEGIMRYFARELGYEEQEEYWGIVGLLHDIDYETYPEEHCVKCVELLREHGVEEQVIRSVVSHGHQILVDMPPEHEMEKVLYTVDELSGILGAAARLRPSGSVSDMSVKSAKKKFKQDSFAGGCSRETILAGMELLGWDLNYLLEQTIFAMREDPEN